MALGMIWGLATRAAPSESMLRASVAALPAEDRRALRRETREVWRTAGALRGNGKSPARQMITALEAEEFDADAFSAALSASQDRLLRISDQMQAQLLARISAMSVDDRRAFAEALQAQSRPARWRSGNRNEAAD